MKPERLCRGCGEPILKRANVAFCTRACRLLVLPICARDGCARRVRHGRHRYCSRACWIASVPPKVCPACGATFKRRQGNHESNRVYCSDPCQFGASVQGRALALFRSDSSRWWTTAEIAFAVYGSSDWSDCNAARKLRRDIQQHGVPFDVDRGNGRRPGRFRLREEAAS